MADHTTHPIDQILIDYLKLELTCSKWLTAIITALASTSIIVNTESLFVRITWGLATAVNLYAAAAIRRQVRRVENP